MLQAKRPRENWASNRGLDCIYSVHICIANIHFKPLGVAVARPHPVFGLGGSQRVYPTPIQRSGLSLIGHLSEKGQYPRNPVSAGFIPGQTTLAPLGGLLNFE
jgi:hypothetical protein